MKHQRIDPAARVWIVFRGPDGRLQHDLDPALLESLGDTEEISDAVVQAAGEMDVSETRLW